MSYAGPASRGKRVRQLDIDPGRRGESPSFRGARAGREGADYSASTGRRPVRASAASRDWTPPALFAAGILLGVALGAGGALLFAPRSGDETRLALKRRAVRLQHRGQDAWDDLREELRRARRRRRRRAEESSVRER